MAHNITLKELAEIAGCTVGTILNLQGGHIPPFYMADRMVNGTKYYAGDIRPYVEKICRHFNETPGDLFPRDICDIQRHELFKDQVSYLLISQYSKNEYDPDNWQLRDRLLKCLATLRPKEEQILLLIYFYGCNLGEAAASAGYKTKERVRQIQFRALRKLRHPTRSRLLKDFV